MSRPRNRIDLDGVLLAIVILCIAVAIAAAAFMLGADAEHTRCTHHLTRYLP